MRLLLLLLLSCVVFLAAGVGEEERLRLREKVREMFYHAYDGYMTHAFPHDELRPLSLSYTDSLVELGNAIQPTREGYSGVALTLIDALDTLAVMGNASEFARGVRWIGQHVSFDLDVDVSLFETNIRVLGGLLSAHMLAAGEVPGAAHVVVPAYDGALLRLATQLGDRFLSAFEPGVATGACSRLPRAFVNLRGGVPRTEKQEQCTAGAGTLLLEMGTLSRLTGNASYEKAAMCALRLLWGKRSHLDLLGNSIDASTGAWRNAAAGIGAGSDSFYEYLLKGYLVFGHPELFTMWNASYIAVRTHLLRGGWYGEAHMSKGGLASTTLVDSLAAFWPALQVLAGDVSDASQLHAGYHAIWRRFGALPERFDLRRGQVADGAWCEAYPLRPELAESCYALHMATQSDVTGRDGGPVNGPADGRYLAMGAEMVTSIDRFMRVPGGFAALSSVQNRKQQDHMPSFFLAETLKYLFLLFDEANFVNTHGVSLLFTTEGHLIPLSLRLSLPSDLVPSTRVRLPPLGARHHSHSDAGSGDRPSDSARAPHAPTDIGTTITSLVVSQLPASEALRGLGARELRSLTAAAPGVGYADCLEMDCLREKATEALQLLRERANQAMTCPLPGAELTPSSI